MGKNKKGTTECTSQSNQRTLEEQPKKKKLRAETPVDCKGSRGSPASKLINKAVVYVVEDKLTEVDGTALERKLKKESKKKRSKMKEECATDIKMAHKLLVEEELTAEERQVSERKLKKERKMEARKLKKEHCTVMKGPDNELPVEQELTAEDKRVIERKLKKERKKEERKSKRECPAESKGVKSELSLEEELTAEEIRVFERKLKKERKKEQRKLKQECPTDIKEAAPQKLSGCELALQYLTSWSQKAKDWKFQKTRQTWLLLHLYDPEKVPGSHFSILLDYLEGLRGSARDLTVRKAEALMKEHDANTEDETLQELVERARQVIQLLS